MKDGRLLEMWTFKAVVETGGFTAAAHALNASQPFVSQTITHLERRLGVQLLYHSTHKQRLTSKGKRFLASCHGLLEVIGQAETQICTAGSMGDLRVSVPQAFDIGQIVLALPGSLSTYPELTVRFSLSDSPINLIKDNFGMAVRMGRLQDSSLRSRRLYELQRIIIAAPSYLARYGMPVTSQGLDHHQCLPWDTPWERLNRWPFMMNDKSEEFLVRGGFRSADGSTLFELYVAGIGVMWLAEHLALPVIRSGKLMPLLSDCQTQDDTAIYVVYLPKRQLTPRIRAFVNYFVEVFR